MAMDAAQQMEPLVIGLLNDDDHIVRAEAARALAGCNSPLAQQALREVLMDRSATVREAAEQSLRRLTTAEQETAAASTAAAVPEVESDPLMPEQST